MAMMSDDLVANLLDHQSRVNFALDDGDVNTVIEDLFQRNDIIGMASDSASAVGYAYPHHYDDSGQSLYDFASWS
jgi:hypothetical protein